MKKLLLIAALFCAAATSAQDSLKKFYLPVTAYADDSRFNAELRQLASVLLQTKTDKSVNRLLLHLMAADYNTALRLIDSTEKANGSMVPTFSHRVYAAAGLKSQQQNVPFNAVFEQIFAERFAALSPNQQLKVAGLDSVVIAGAGDTFKKTKERLQKMNKDSLSWKDAQLLAQHYSRWWLLNSAAPTLIAVSKQERFQQLMPGIKGHDWGAIAPIQGVTFHSDHNMKYNLLLELTAFVNKSDDSLALGSVNPAIAYTGRLINLHMVDGIPKKNINVVMAVHGMALNAFLSNEKYKAKYGMDNPNLALIKELQAFGVKMIACGQAMYFQNLEKADMTEGVEVAVSAQTVLSAFQLKNYVLYNLGQKD
jgi:intracellular sulfur oxidation DsrE/DsrF family protein